MYRTLRVAIACTLCAVPALLKAQSTALVGGTILDGNGGPAIANGVVVTSGGHITCVGTVERCPVPAGAQRVDATGTFITPGLVDAHVHFSQTGWVDGRPDGISAPEIYPYLRTARELRAHPERWFASYLCSGITAVYDVGGHPWTTTLPSRAEPDLRAPHVRAAGPLVTHATRTALMADDSLYTFLPMETADEVRSSVARLVAMGSTAVKVWYLAPPAARRADLDQRLMEVGAAVRAAGLDLIVHATSLREAKMALRAGAVLLVHSVQDEPVDDEFIALMRQNHAIYAPTLVVGGNWTRALASIALGVPYEIDDVNRCVDSATVAHVADVAPLRPLVPEPLRHAEPMFRRLENGGAQRAVMAANLRRVHEAGITVATATDAGNPLTLHGPSIYQEMEAMEVAGLAPEAIVTISTKNGALAMGRLDDFGTVERGKMADLLILNTDPRTGARAFRDIRWVMRGGRLHRQEDLRVR